MSESKHTPGDWEVRPTTTGHIAVYPVGSNERVADVYCPLDVKGGHVNGNARLIAAAPRLLMKAESFLEVVDKYSTASFGEAEDEFRDAINRARGEAS